MRSYLRGLSAIMWLLDELGSVLGSTTCLLGSHSRHLFALPWRAAAVTLLVTMAGRGAGRGAKLGFIDSVPHLLRNQRTRFIQLSEADTLCSCLRDSFRRRWQQLFVGPGLRSPWARAAVWSMAAIPSYRSDFRGIYLRRGLPK